MLLKIFSVHDSKAHAYGVPFFLHQEGMAVRTFTDMCNDENHAFHHHPADYTLFTLGVYDDETGKIDPVTPQSLCNGVDVKNPS